MSADKTLFYMTALMIGIGIAFSLSLPVFTVLYLDFSQYHFFIRQGLVGLIAIFIIWAISQLDPDKKIFGNMKTFEFLGFALFFGSAFVIMIMQFLPSSMVPLTGGAKRWIRLGPISLSPVEFFKVGFVFFLAWSFTRKLDHQKKRLKEEFKLLMPYFIVLGIASFFILILQKDLGQMVVLLVTLMVLATFAGISKKFFALVSVMGAMALFAAIITQPHRIRRFEGWWVTIQDMILPFLPKSVADFLYVSDAEEPYQITHSLNAMYHGGFFGSGLGGGTFKLGFLSEVHTDFVLAGMTEEIGFLGLILVCICMVILIFRILKISARSNDNVYHLFSLGIGLIISVAFIMNAFGISSIIPIKGIAVPFLSYGGSSVLALSFAIGMVLMVSKKVDLS